MPFKIVAVDIVGSIAPPSEAGHRYILTLVDYATRYPEAVPVKKITTEAITVELWTKEVNVPKVKTSNEYVTELHGRLEDSLKLAQEEI